jgi:hypothetical protein
MNVAPIFDVAQRLGARLKRVAANEFAGPCRRCGGRDRFSVNTARCIWNRRGCGRGGDAIELVRPISSTTFAEACTSVGEERAVEMAAGRHREAYRQLPPPAPAEQSAGHERVAQALVLWDGGVDPRKTIVEVYLNRRGLALDAGVAGPVLRWHSGAGAMLGLFRSAMTGEPQAVSRTFLSAVGWKLSRKFFGPVGCAAIKLDVPGDELVIAEGVESAMTARALGYGPTWAVDSAGAIATLPLIPGVAFLRICVEHDKNGANERAALACSDRWEKAGRKVSFKLPPPRCKDANDAIRQDSP